jgi:cytochrome c oxidase cbb3-type subunit I
MLNPYFLMVILYLGMAVLLALDNALGLLNIVPGFQGIRWLRIHFVTLGLLTEAAFWLMPALVAARQQKAPPPTRWDIWLALNGGIITLLIGIPLLNSALIITGGTLVFIAVALLIGQLLALHQPGTARRPAAGLPFYVAGLSYLLLGIIVGTGLWQGWGEALRIKVPIEVHIHANSWGFMSLLFAGLLVDAFPAFSGKTFAWPRSVPAIFWLMTLGALGLVLGPWTGSNLFSVPGLLLHSAATILLLANVIRPLRGERWSAGMWHLVTSYFWFFAPVLVAPLIIAKVPGFPGAGIESNAPQALVYGWVLQFAYAILPFYFARIFLRERAPRLGGSWFSLLASHAAGFIFWAGIFLLDYQALLQGIAYSLWFLAMLPIAYQIWQIVRQGLEPGLLSGRVEQVADETVAAD